MPYPVKECYILLNKKGYKTSAYLTKMEVKCSYMALLMCRNNVQRSFGVCAQPISTGVTMVQSVAVSAKRNRIIIVLKSEAGVFSKH